MPEPGDMELLDEFALRNSQEAFSTLVRRHVNLVYAVALRNVGDNQKAEDVTQAVFVILAQKAGHLNRRTVLTGWLYQTARLTSRNLVRQEMRRQRREQEAIMQSISDQSHHESDWARLAPVLDEALARLGEKERNAILMRFFEGRTAPEAAAALAVNESALKARVSRGLEKMRKFFARHGITLSATVLAGVLAANPAQAAPSALVSSAAAIGVAKGTTATASTLTLIKMTMNTMKWIKIKAVAVAAGLSLAAVTATTVAVSGNLTGSGLGQADVQFKEFLDHPPAHLRAVYEEDGMVGARGRRISLGQDFTTTNSLKLDGDNSLLSVSSSRPEARRSLGQFEGTSWIFGVVQVWQANTNLPPLDTQAFMAMDPDQRQQLMQSRRKSGTQLPDQGRLEMADPKINLPGDTNAQNLVNNGRISRDRANRLLNLGIEEMVPGTLVWDPDNHGFTASFAKWFPGDAVNARAATDDGRPPMGVAKYTDGTMHYMDGTVYINGMPNESLATNGQLTVRLEYENGLPVKASVHTTAHDVFTINYKYRPDFCNGQFPAEISRVGDGGTTRFTLRLQQLEIADQPFPKAELDPNEVFRNSFPVLTTIIHSNGAPYELKDGQLVPRPGH